MSPASQEYSGLPRGEGGCHSCESIQEYFVADVENLLVLVMALAFKMSLRLNQYNVHQHVVTQVISPETHSNVTRSTSSSVKRKPNIIQASRISCH